MMKRIGVAALLSFLIAGCGGGTTQVKKGQSVRTLTGKKKKKSFIEEEELTEKKIEVKKAPEYIPGVDKGAQDAFRAGVKAVMKTPPDYATARAKFEEAIAKDPKFLEAYFNLGMVYERQGQQEKALQVYHRALKANPKSLDAKAYIAKVYLAKAKKAKKLGRSLEASTMEQKAKQLLDEVINQNPDNVAGLNAMALYWLYKGDLKSTEDYVKRVLMLQPNNVVGLNTRGLVNYLSGKYLIARWIFEEKALKIDKNSTEAWNNLGLVYMKLNIVPKAVECFIKALNANPENQEAMMNLAAIYLNYLNYKAAYDLYSKVLKLDPENPEALIGMGTSSLGMHKTQDAVKYYLAALKVAPQKYILYKRLGELYETQLNDLEKAVSYYEKYVSLAHPPKTDEVVQKIPALKQMIQMSKNPPKMAPQPQEQGNPQPQGQQPGTQQKQQKKNQPQQPKPQKEEKKSPQGQQKAQPGAGKGKPKVEGGKK